MTIKNKTRALGLALLVGAMPLMAKENAVSSDGYSSLKANNIQYPFSSVCVEEPKQIEISLDQSFTPYVARGGIYKERKTLPLTENNYPSITCEGKPIEFIFVYNISLDNFVNPKEKKKNDTKK